MVERQDIRGRYSGQEIQKLIKKAEKKRRYDPRKTALALGNLAPLVYEVLAENVGGVDTQGYQVELEANMEQKFPGEDREETYKKACNTLRGQGKSMRNIADTLLRDSNVLTAFHLGQMTKEKYELAVGKFIDSLAEYYPGAKTSKSSSIKKTFIDW